MGMNVRDQVVRFLKTSPSIGAVNFCAMGTKIWPDAYRTGVANAVASGEIRQGTTVNDDASATYRQVEDRLEILSTFSFSSLHDLGLLLHECTHAILDMRAFGAHSGHFDETIAYLAQALFLVHARGNASTVPDKPRPDIPNRRDGAAIYYEAGRIAAKAVRNRAYRIPDDDVRSLMRIVASNPVYRDAVTYESNRFRRSIVHGAMRYTLPLVWKLTSFHL
jgi:hypothetical protein